jgi:hypothetical protein
MDPQTVITPELKLEILGKIKKKTQQYYEAASENADCSSAEELISEISITPISQI